MITDKGRIIHPPEYGMAITLKPIFYRPPPEAYSLILMPTIGCPWNRCVFCGTHKDEKYFPRPLNDVLEDIVLAKNYYGDKVKRVFLAEANTIALKVEKLLKILDFLYKCFPKLERISCYGGAKFIKGRRKDLKMLGEAGLNKIYMGLESGDDEVLRLMEKGVTSKDMIEAAEIVKDANIKLSVTVIQGLAGAEKWEKNAELTAKNINQMKPDEVRLHSLIIHPKAPLHKLVLEGKFKEASWYEILLETKKLIENINIQCFIINHASHYLIPGLIHGNLPSDKELLITTIDSALLNPEVFVQKIRRL